MLKPMALYTRTLCAVVSPAEWRGLPPPEQFLNNERLVSAVSYEALAPLVFDIQVNTWSFHCETAPCPDNNEL